MGILITMPFATIEEAIADFQAGRMVVIVDDEDRENEGDLACAAEKVTPEIINFMAREGRGLICLPLTEEHCQTLQLPLQVTDQENGTHFGTAFTVSIEARHGVTTGISAADRARTILTAVAPRARPEDLVRPGHIFPLRAKPGGVLMRPGQTEASVDLARLAGLHPSGVICEIMNDDGTMARLPELESFAARHCLRIISVADLIRYRIRTERSVQRLNEAVVPTIHGDFRAIAYQNQLNGEVHLAMVMGEIDPETPILVRVHTQSVLSDVFGSLHDSHGSHLQVALRRIREAGQGIVLYLKQEMVGVGLADQLIHYRHLPDHPLAAEEGDPSQERDPMREVRDYGTGAQILHDLGVRQLRLLTNRPPRLSALEGFQLEIIDHVPLDT
jgi:3,4-dihydroxy 2-butanone 4-phosphate synthase/GTP cyclohydrolase II